MLSYSVLRKGQKEYYLAMSPQAEYFTGSGEPPGLWMGEGAEQLGLSGEIDHEEFSYLFHGLSPDGSAKLVQNAEEENRRPGWDLTFSAPKSVSVAWSQADRELGGEIRAAHREAVTKAFGYLEEHCGFTRRGKGGFIREKGKLVAAGFEHGTSRALDPQLHTHVLLLNIGVQENGFTGALTSKEFYEHKMAAGAIYRAELAHQLESRLGLEAEKKRTWFELKGVSNDLISHFSKRRQEVEAALAEKGYSGAKASEIAALDSRKTKVKVDRRELFKEWRAIGREIGWGPEAFRQLVSRSQPTHAESSEVAARRCVEEAIENITANEAYFSERELIRRTAEVAPGSGLSADRVIAAAEEFLEKEAIKLESERGYPQFTTQEMLDLERDMLDRVERSREKSGHEVPEKVVDGVLADFEKRGDFGGLNEDQKKALRHITEESGRIKCVSGMAGTGKTTMLEAAREAWEAAGYRVTGAALAGKAADGLTQGAGIESQTIARMIYQLDDGKPVLDKNSILVVDEAGMVGTRSLHRLTQAVEEAGAKLVLVGDAKQLQPIEAGGPFNAIIQRLGDAAMSTIIRQTEEWQRNMVEAFSKGEAGKALRELDKRGALHIAEDRKQAQEDLVKHWRTTGLADPENTLVLTGTNKDANLLNREIQAMRLAEGQLGSDYVSNEHARFRENDRVVFTKNSGPRGVRNGNLGTVEEVNEAENSLRIRGDNGRLVEISLSDYDHLKLAYCVTTHKSQGMTCNGTVYVLTDEGMQDRSLSYVQASRSRVSTQIFSTKEEAGADLALLSKKMSRERLKRMASDLKPEVSDQRHEPEKPQISQGLEISL